MKNGLKRFGGQDDYTITPPWAYVLVVIVIAGMSFTIWKDISDRRQNVQLKELYAQNFPEESLKEQYWTICPWERIRALQSELIFKKGTPPKEMVNKAIRIARTRRNSAYKLCMKLPKRRVLLIQLPDDIARISEVTRGDQDVFKANPDMVLYKSGLLADSPQQVQTLVFIWYNVFYYVSGEKATYIGGRELGPFPLVSGTQIFTAIVYDMPSGRIIGESSWENEFGQRDLVPEDDREYLFNDFREWVRK